MRLIAHGVQVNAQKQAELMNIDGKLMVYVERTRPELLGLIAVSEDEDRSWFPRERVALARKKLQRYNSRHLML